MKSQILDFINNLILYDYILFGAAFVAFILLIILGLVLRKRMLLAIFLIILAFLILPLTPTVFYNLMHDYLFKNEVTLVSQKKLQFTNAIVVRGTLENQSNFDFYECKINAKVHKVSKNALKNYVWQLKSIKNMSMLEYDIPKGETITFKMIIEPFTYSREYNLTIRAKCK